MARVWAIPFVCILLLASAASCVVHADRAVRGSGRVTEEVHKFRGFTGVELGTVGDLYVKKGRRNELRVEAEENLHEYLKFEVSDGRLEIKSRRGVNLRPRRTIKYYLTVKELDEVVLSGSGNIQAPDLEGRRVKVLITGSGNVDVGDMDADEIAIKISGSGDLRAGRGDAEEIEVTVRGSGNIELQSADARAVNLNISGSGNVDVGRGEVRRQRIHITGSGDYDARRVRSLDAEVVITGSGNATIMVEDRLVAKISGSGDVRYEGRPDVRGSVSGSGDLERI